LRWTDEQKKWQGRSQMFIQALGGGFNPALTINTLGEPLAANDFVRFPNGVSPVGRKDASEPTWRLTGSFKFRDDIYGYGTISRGFKSGGFNDQTGTSGNAIATTGPAAFGAYGPEFATSYELGLKTELFDRRLRLNTAVFYVEYEDAQRALVSTITNSAGATFQETRFFNAADVEVKGIEVEATAALTDNWSINVALGYQDGKYKKFEADSNGDGRITNGGPNPMGGTFPVEVFTNQPLARTPELQYAINLNYDWSFANGASLRWNALLHHEDESLFILSDLGSRFNGVLDAKDLLSTSLTYTSPSGQWWVRAYGKNLTDERYRIAVQPVANLWTHAQYGEPRSYGVDFGMRFGANRP
ncbi:MAG: TonB-dependent receptor, partial [Steroidobacteraceae bacterium]|nr:TonB-dependent receptor [Steroidobacteraceae bacterium]